MVAEVKRAERPGFEATHSITIYGRPIPNHAHNPHNIPAVIQALEKNLIIVRGGYLKPEHGVYEPVDATDPGALLTDGLIGRSIRAFETQIQELEPNIQALTQSQQMDAERWFYLKGRHGRWRIKSTPAIQDLEAERNKILKAEEDYTKSLPVQEQLKKQKKKINKFFKKENVPPETEDMMNAILEDERQTGREVLTTTTRHPDQVYTQYKQLMNELRVYEAELDQAKEAAGFKAQLDRVDQAITEAEKRAAWFKAETERGALRVKASLTRKIDELIPLGDALNSLSPDSVRRFQDIQREIYCAQCVLNNMRSKEINPCLQFISGTFEFASGTEGSQRALKFMGDYNKAEQDLETKIALRWREFEQSTDIRRWIPKPLRSLYDRVASPSFNLSEAPDEEKPEAEIMEALEGKHRGHTIDIVRPAEKLTPAEKAVRPLLEGEVSLEEMEKKVKVDPETGEIMKEFLEAFDKQLGRELRRSGNVSESTDEKIILHERVFTAIIAENETEFRKIIPDLTIKALSEFYKELSTFRYLFDPSIPVKIDDLRRAFMQKLREIDKIGPRSNRIKSANKCLLLASLTGKAVLERSKNGRT